MSGVPKPHVATRYQVATHGTHKPMVVVIHDTESHDAAGIGDITGIASFWQRQGMGLGSQFIIDKDGNIGQGCNSKFITWAVAGHNTGCIHIELIGFAWFSPRIWLARRKQMAATRRLVAFLCDYWHIPATFSTTHGVCRHADFHAGHTDPGKGFPFFNMLKGVQKIIAAHR